jgi:hypothetical protein
LLSAYIARLDFADARVAGLHLHGFIVDTDADFPIFRRQDDMSIWRSPPANSAVSTATASGEFLRNAFRDVYLYAYPIVNMDVTMHQATNVPNASMINMRTPAGTFSSHRWKDQFLAP